MDYSPKLRSLLWSFWLFYLVLYLSSCSVSPVVGLYPPGPQATKTIQIVNYGWHSGIIIQRQDIPDFLQPEIAEFPQATHIEFGWGNADYYQSREPTSGMGLTAVLSPTSSVLHIVALDEGAEHSFPEHLRIALRLSDLGFHELCHYIYNSYARDAQGRTLPTGKGLYPHSRFYQSQEAYHLFHMCNHWTAAAIRAAGFPISPGLAFTSDNVLQQLRNGLDKL